MNIIEVIKKQIFNPHKKGIVITNADLQIVQKFCDDAEVLIRAQMNFYKYYQTDLKDDERIELNALSNNGALFNLILNVYAIYESTMKNMFVYTLEIIDKKQIKINDLNSKIRTLYFRENIEELRKTLTSSNPSSQEIISKKIIKIHDSLSINPIFEAKEEMINTKSNLLYDNLLEISYYFNLSDLHLKRYKPAIKSLVHYRNNIAHGNNSFTGYIPERMIHINDESYERICEDIILVIKVINNHLVNFINNESYK